MKLKRKNKPGAGRPVTKEPTRTISVRVPVAKYEILKTKIKNLISKDMYYIKTINDKFIGYYCEETDLSEAWDFDSAEAAEDVILANNLENCKTVKI